MNVIPFSLLGVGFLLGVKHAFDIDHVAAISTIASNLKSIKKSSLLGMSWGIGHTISLFFIGLIVLLLKVTIPKKLALFLELVVGVMLILLGINVLLTINKNKIHLHKHKHGKVEHVHFHSHKLVKQHGHEHRQFKQSLIIGLLHGLAGSAAITLLVLTTINSVLLGLTYILLFGIGSIMGMVLITTIISLPFKLIPNNLQKTQKFLRVSAGLISAIIGLIIMYNTIFIRGLLI